MFDKTKHYLINGDIKAIRALDEMGLLDRRDENICMHAADNIKCLSFLRGRGYSWNENTPIHAIKKNNLECFRYAIDNGCPCGPRLKYHLIKRAGTEFLGHIFAKDKSQWNTWASACAAGYGRLDNLKFLKENGCPWDEKTPFYSYINGQIACLEYALTQKCPFDGALVEQCEKRGDKKTLALLNKLNK